MKKVLVPRVRFKGFSEEWKEEVLGKIIKSAYIGISSKILITGKYEVIQQGIISIAGYTNEQPFENYEKIVLFGDHSLSVYKPKKPFLLASDGIKAYFIENTYGDYFYYLLGNNLPENEGYKRYSLILKEKNIGITYNKSEQQKIGKLLENIDNLITLEEIKLNKLKQLKQTLLQKMFPEGNSKTPRIRFRGFDEVWKEKKLEYIAKVTNGKSNTSDNNKWGQYNLYIRSEEIYKSNKYIFDVEGVITVGDGNIGKIFHYVNGKFDLHQRCYLIYEFQNIWPKYFYYYFSQNFYKRAILMSYTATVNSIRMNTITDMDIMFPKELIEQQKIGDFFSKVDTLLDLYHSKLNKLKQIKEALLQKMFV